MNKDILNIVVTGGPCGGKTTALDELTKQLRSYGYTVFLVNEAATELINSGIKPFGDNKLDNKDFQSLILETQLAKEQIRKKASLMCSNNKVAILYDRGILDGRAYIDDQTFNELLNKNHLSETDVLTRYDLIIHLVTAAKGKEEFYTLLNNSARTETIEEARYQDTKAMESWRNHPNLRIVDNDTLFDEKIKKVKNLIRAFIGEDEVITQERYLININNIDFNAFNHSMVKEDIEEFVLSYDNDEMELFSKSTINNSNYYTCSKKKKELNAKLCRTITEEEYKDFKNKVQGRILHKIRYNFIDENERFRLDIFEINNKSFAILERDVVNPKRKLPSFIKGAINITNNRDYDDDSIYIDTIISEIYQKRESKGEQNAKLL